MISKDKCLLFLVSSWISDMWVCTFHNLCTIIKHNISGYFIFVLVSFQNSNVDNIVNITLSFFVSHKAFEYVSVHISLSFCIYFSLPLCTPSPFPENQIIFTLSISHWIWSYHSVFYNNSHHFVKICFFFFEIFKYIFLFVLFYTMTAANPSFLFS